MANENAIIKCIFKFHCFQMCSMGSKINYKYPQNYFKTKAQCNFNFFEPYYFCVIFAEVRLYFIRKYYFEEILKAMVLHNPFKLFVSNVIKIRRVLEFIWIYSKRIQFWEHVNVTGLWNRIVWTAQGFLCTVLPINISINSLTYKLGKIGLETLHTSSLATCFQCEKLPIDIEPNLSPQQ